MDNKQAAAMLRTHAAYPGFNYLRQEMERGADALELLEWLFFYGIEDLRREWASTGAVKRPFHAFCEASFKERKNG